MKKILILSLFAIILSNCEVRPIQVKAQESENRVPQLEGNYRHKQFIKFLSGNDVEATIQPWLDEGYRVVSITSETVSTTVGERRGNFVIVLQSPE